MDLQKGLQTNTGFVPPLALCVSDGGEGVGLEQKRCLVAFCCHLPDALCMPGAGGQGHFLAGSQLSFMAGLGPSCSGNKEKGSAYQHHRPRIEKR